MKWTGWTGAALLLLLLVAPGLAQRDDAMTTNHHTPITYNAPANAAIVNAPLAELDASISAEHDVGGGHSESVIDQREILLTTAAAAIRKAIRYDEFTGEHNADGTHKANIIDQAEINLTTAAAAAGKAIRYNEFTVEHNADGTHNINIPLGMVIIWSDSTVSAAANNSAPALPEYEESVGDGASIVCIRTVWQKTAEYDRIGVRGQYHLAAGIGNKPSVWLNIGGASDAFQMVADSAWTDFDEIDLVANVAALADGTTYEITITITSSAGVYLTGKLRYLSVFAYSSTISGVD